MTEPPPPWSPGRPWSVQPGGPPGPWPPPAGWGSPIWAPPAGPQPPGPQPPGPPWVPQPGYPPGYPPPIVTPQGRPVRVDALPGTGFGLAYLGVPPTVSGPAIGSMVAGIGSVLVALVTICFGVAGSGPGWGPLVSGAFAILAGLVGGAALAVGVIGWRRIGRSGGRLSGRGFTVAGVACGASGLGLAALGVLLAVLLVH